MTPTPTMTPAEVAAWERMAREGTLARYLDCDEGNHVNRSNHTASTNTAYHRALRAQVERMRAAAKA